MKFYVSFVPSEAVPASHSSLIIQKIHTFADVSITSEIEYGVLK